jgi:hypothetical protein
MVVVVVIQVGLNFLENYCTVTNSVETYTKW